jgi:cytochrome c oxidase subunit 2
MVVLMILKRLYSRFAVTLLLAAGGAAGLLLLAAERETPDRVINVVAERFNFVPAQIKLKQGEVVELRIRSLDTNHGFAIAEAGIDVIVPKRGKGDARILFRAQKRGVFPFVCSKACGAGHTIMRGRIVVK